MKVYKKSGINRISIGVQAWQDKHLKFLGRSYTIYEFLKKYELTQKVGFKNINLDMIFGFPNQTFLDFSETLENLIKLSPTHISCYSLEIEEKTLFGELHKKNLLFSNFLIEKSSVKNFEIEKIYEK